jgi:hypothetical protein
VCLSRNPWMRRLLLVALSPQVTCSRTAMEPESGVPPIPCPIKAADILPQTCTRPESWRDPGEAMWPADSHTVLVLDKKWSSSVLPGAADATCPLSPWRPQHNWSCACLWTSQPVTQQASLQGVGPGFHLLGVCDSPANYCLSQLCRILFYFIFNGT